jgi:hypothetical protein
MGDTEIDVKASEVETTVIPDGEPKDAETAGGVDTLKGKNPTRDDAPEDSAMRKAAASMKELFDEKSQPDNMFIMHEDDETILSKATYSSHLPTKLALALAFPPLIFLHYCNVVRAPQVVV